MKRTSIWKRVMTLGLSTALGAALLAGTAGDADAGKKTKKAKAAAVKKKAGPTAEQKKALGEVMGAFTFGMSKDDVIKTITSQLNERYAEKIAETSDVYVQDKLRREKKKELKRITKSYVQFEGKKTGWDVSIVDDQFGHKTDEAMLVHWENEGGRDQRRFFFFHEGSLYKMFIAIGASQIQEDQRNFEFFKGLMEARFGEGDVNPRGVSWGTGDFSVDALDKLGFYGSFCLVIAKPDVVKAVAAAREAVKTEKKSNALIDAVIEGEDDTPSLDANKAGVDAVIKGNN
jgi:hypothetical protein